MFTADSSKSIESATPAHTLMQNYCFSQGLAKINNKRYMALRPCLPMRLLGLVVWMEKSSLIPTLRSENLADSLTECFTFFNFPAFCWSAIPASHYICKVFFFCHMSILIDCVDSYLDGGVVSALSTFKSHCLLWMLQAQYLMSWMWVSWDKPVIMSWWIQLESAVVSVWWM